MGNVFISYCHTDEHWKNQIVKQLGVLEKDIKLIIWDDSKISGGNSWVSDIEEAIKKCDVALLLITADFLKSEFILGIEVPKLLNRRVNDGIRLIPIIIRDCPWKTVSWLSSIQARPTDGKALATIPLSKRDTVLSDLAQEVFNLIQQPPAQVMPKQESSSTLSGPLTEGAVNSFLDLLASFPMLTSVKNHLMSIIRLGEETATTEDDFIQARLDFWRDISSNQKKLITLLRHYIASAPLTLDSFMVAYEFGRILTENRRGDLAYEVLYPLEYQMLTCQVDVPRHHWVRILDGIGESARFAGEFSTAKRLYNLALKYDLNNYFALKHLGTIYRIENNFLKAKEYFEKAINTHETYHVLFSFGYLYHDLKHFDEAQPYYDKCVTTLLRLKKENYYRVYFKLACLHLIRRGPTASEDALKNAMQTLSSLKSCSQNPAELDDFALITYFASYLLISLIHDNTDRAVEALEKCESFLERYIDRLTHSVFYCAYRDIERVLAENTDLRTMACKRLGDHASRLERILDQLLLKHILLQSSDAQGHMRSLTVATERIEVLVKPVEKVGEETNALKEAMRAFEFPPWRSAGEEQAPLETYKIAISNLDVTIGSIRTALGNLLDRASVSLWLKSWNKNQEYDGASVLKPFTAVLPENLRAKHFSDYFHVPVPEVESMKMSRILGKKLICLDPLTKNRVFINPTVGCSINCKFCYLPEYSIKNSIAPTPATIDGETYRKAIELDKIRVHPGKDGTLFSLGSFCEPFLPEVVSLTVSILRELQPLGNSIQIASKRFPGIGALNELIALYEKEPQQLMVNLSLNDRAEWDKNHISKWLEHSANICTTIYIKPFLTETNSQMFLFEDIGRKYRNVSFVVGSFYVGKSIRQMPSSGFKSDRYISIPSLVSPVVDEPKGGGFAETSEDSFRKELAEKIGRPVFKTASCALSCNRKIKDPLRNYETPFCIKNDCSNYKIICPSEAEVCPQLGV